MSLRLSPDVSEFSLCWYNCNRPQAEGRIRLAHDGNVPLLQVSNRLFASARVVGLGQVKKIRDPAEVYIVTTPAAYRPFLSKTGRGGKHEGASAFAKRIDAKFIRYFDSGVGPRIEIYAKRPRKE